MALTVKECLGHIQHALGGSLSSGINPTNLINRAGEFLTSAHTWSWLENGTAKLDLRANITIAGGTTNGSPGTTLTKTGAFTNYSFVEGDQVEITSGTGVTAGFYKILSRTNDNDILVDVTPGVSGSAIAATIHADAVALPSDFRELLSYEASNSLTNSLQLTTMQHLVELRANNLQASGGGYFGAIVFPIPGTETKQVGPRGAPVPRLELYPVPDANLVGGLTISYRRNWYSVSTDAVTIRVPSYVEGPFIQVLRAFAKGYEEDDTASIDMRVAEIVSGPLFMGAVARDALSQPNYGRMRGGITQSRSSGSSSLKNSVPGPS